MPSLADRIAQNRKLLTRDPSGQLVENTQEEVQSLAQKAGMAAPPTTPAGGAMIGANEHQQKMMGTPAQKTSALTISQSPELNLQDAQRRAQVRTQATATEQQKIQKSENLQNLGGLGDRVNSLINAEKSKLDQANASLKAAEAGQNKSGQTQSLADLKPILEQLAANPSDMNLQLQVNKALGYDGSRQLSPEEIQSLYADSTQSIAQSGADAIANNITAGDLISQGGLGYTPEQLADLLGVPADQVSGMTVSQIHDQINKLMAQEFNTTAQLGQKAQSTELGVAERGLARQAGREASAVGIRSTEHDVARLEDEIAKAGTVSFGGQQMSIEQALSDDNISKTVSDYLNSAPDSPLRKQLEATEPQLVQFIKRNENVLDDASKQLGAGATQFSDLQSANKTASTLGGKLSPELAAKVVPGFNELSATSLDPNSVPVLAVAQGMDEGQKQAYAQDLGQIVNQYPAAAEELKALSADELRKLELDKTGGKWNQFIQDSQKYEQLANIADGDIQALGTAIFGTDADWSSEIARDKSNSILGTARHNKAFDILDADGDGQIDKIEDIKGRVAGQRPSLHSVLEGKSVGIPRDPGETPTIDHYNKDLQRDGLIAGDKDAVRSALSDSLSQYAADGRLAPDEVEKVYGGSRLAKANKDGLQARVQELSYLLDNGQLDSDTRRTVKDLISQTRDKLSADVRDLIFGEESGFKGTLATRVFDTKDLSKLLDKANIGDNVGMLDKPTRKLYESLQEYSKLANSNKRTAEDTKRLQKLEKTIGTLRDEMGYVTAAEKKEAEEKSKRRTYAGGATVI